MFLISLRCAGAVIRAPLERHAAAVRHFVLLLTETYYVFYHFLRYIGSLLPNFAGDRFGPSKFLPDAQARQIVSLEVAPLRPFSIFFSYR